MFSKQAKAIRGNLPSIDSKDVLVVVEEEKLYLLF